MNEIVARWAAERAAQAGLGPRAAAAAAAPRAGGGPAEPAMATAIQNPLKS